MRYTADIARVPLSVYIALMAGDDVRFDVSREKAKMRMMSQYMDIVGGASYKAMLGKENARYAEGVRMQCLTVAQNLLTMQDIEGAKAVLTACGYRAKGTDAEAISKEIEAWRARIEWDKARREQAEQNAPKREEQRLDVHSQFAREKAVVMQFYKFAFNNDSITTLEYAYMVAQMNEQLLEQKRHNDEMRRKLRTK